MKGTAERFSLSFYFIYLQNIFETTRKPLFLSEKLRTLLCNRKQQLTLMLFAWA